MNWPFIGLISIGLLIIAQINSWSVAFPLAAILTMLLLLLRRQGHPFPELLRTAYEGGRTALVVLKIFILIGAIIAIWIAAGTVPALVYYSLQLIAPQWFILFAFLLCAIISSIIGTSFGTAGTIGVALMLMAKGTNVNPDIVMGAIMSGIYLGDRCSPLSSSAALIATLTGTSLPDNLKNMLRTTWLPLGITIILYGIISLFLPPASSNTRLINLLPKFFELGLWELLPAALVIILILLRLGVKLAMLISIICAWLIASFHQGTSQLELINYLLLGYQLPPEHPLAALLKGGGLISMATPAVVVFLACAISNLIDKTGVLTTFTARLHKVNNHRRFFGYTLLVSWLTAAIGCNQTISSVMTYYTLRPAYQELKLSAPVIALDLENSGILLAALVPWSIAAFVPTQMMNMPMASYLPWALYLYILPLVYWLRLPRQPLR